MFLNYQYNRIETYFFIHLAWICGKPYRTDTLLRMFDYRKYSSYNISVNSRLLNLILIIFVFVKIDPLRCPHPYSLYTYVTCSMGNSRGMGGTWITINYEYMNRGVHTLSQTSCQIATLIISLLLNATRYLTRAFMITFMTFSWVLMALHL